MDLDPGEIEFGVDATLLARINQPKVSRARVPENFERRRNFLFLLRNTQKRIFLLQRNLTQVNPNKD